MVNLKPKVRVFVTLPTAERPERTVAIQSLEFSQAPVAFIELTDSGPGKLRMDSGQQAPEFFKASELAFGILGIVKVPTAGHCLALVKDAELVDRLCGEPVYRITKTSFLPFEDVWDESSSERYSVVRNACAPVAKFLEAGDFFFSPGYNLTRSLQGQSDAGLGPTGNGRLQPSRGASGATDQATGVAVADPLSFRAWVRSFDRTFWWNRYMLAYFLHRMRAYALTPIIKGAVSISRCHAAVPEAGLTEPLELAVVSRIGCRHAGTRFNARGITDDGDVANFVETEQIAYLQGQLTSFIQTRGSVPVFWEQKFVKTSYQISVNRTVEATAPAFAKHVASEFERCGCEPIFINLLSAKDKERTLSDAYRRQVSAFNEAPSTSAGPVAYHEFDVRARCPSMKFEELTPFLNKVFDQSAQRRIGFFWHKTGDAAADRLDSQAFAFRTNCLDCLDRTNFFQTAIAWRSLQSVLARFGIDSSLVSQQLYPCFIKLWETNGMCLSKEYAGASSSKANYSRKEGKRAFLKGLVDDAKTHAQRFVGSDCLPGKFPPCTLGRVTRIALRNVCLPDHLTRAAELGKREAQLIGHQRQLLRQSGSVHSAGSGRSLVRSSRRAVLKSSAVVLGNGLETSTSSPSSGNSLLNVNLSGSSNAAQLSVAHHHKRSASSDDSGLRAVSQSTPPWNSASLSDLSFDESPPLKTAVDGAACAPLLPPPSSSVPLPACVFSLHPVADRSVLLYCSEVAEPSLNPSWSEFRFEKDPGSLQKVLLRVWTVQRGADVTEGDLLLPTQLVFERIIDLNRVEPVFPGSNSASHALNEVLLVMDTEEQSSTDVFRVPSQLDHLTSLGGSWTEAARRSFTSSQRYRSKSLSAAPVSDAPLSPDAAAVREDLGQRGSSEQNQTTGDHDDHDQRSGSLEANRTDPSSVASSWSTARSAVSRASAVASAGTSPLSSLLDAREPLPSYSKGVLARLISHRRAELTSIVQRNECLTRINQLLDEHRVPLATSALSDQRDLQLAALAAQLDSEEADIERQEAELADLEVDLVSRVRDLATSERDLLSAYKRIEKERALLLADHQRLAATTEVLRGQEQRVLWELLSVYPIKANEAKQFAIGSFFLPHSDFTGADEDMVSAGLGCVAHVVLLCSQYLQVPLRYPVHPLGSRSVIRDEISQQSAPIFPLYCRGVDRNRFEYAVFLLNKNIEQLVSARGLDLTSLRNTLPNLKSLLESR